MRFRTVRLGVVSFVTTFVLMGTLTTALANDESPVQIDPAAAVSGSQQPAPVSPPSSQVGPCGQAQYEPLADAQSQAIVAAVSHVAPKWGQLFTEQQLVMESQSAKGFSLSTASCGQFTGLIIPLRQVGAELEGHIFYYEGTWLGESYSEAFAVKGWGNVSRVIYRLFDGQLQTVSLEEAVRILPINFDAVPAPMGALAHIQMDVAETTGRIAGAGNGSGLPGKTTQGSGCITVYVPKSGYSVFGSLLYTFWQRKGWCYTESSVYNVTVGAYATDIAPTISFLGVVASWDSPSSVAHGSFRQGTFQNCIPLAGCWGAGSPWIEIWSYTNGNWTYNTGF